MHNRLRCLPLLLLATITYAQEPFWEQTNGPWGGQITAIAKILNDGGVLFAGTNGSGVYKSTNEGTDWQESSSGLTNLYVTLLETDSVGRVFCGTGDGLFLSTDRGEAWTRIDHEFAGSYLRSFAALPSGKIFVSVSASWDNDSSVVWESTNSGSSWSEPLDSTITFLRAQVAYYTYKHKLLLLTKDKLYESTDEGVTWGAIDTAGSGWTGYNKIFTFRNSPRIFVEIQGHPQGAGAPGLYFVLYASDDEGRTWRNFDNPGTYFSYQAYVIQEYPSTLSLAIDDSGYVYAGTTQSGVARARTNSTAEYPWSIASSDIVNSHVPVVLFDPSTKRLYAGSSGGFCYSADRGRSWVESDYGIQNISVFSLAVSRTWGDIYAATTSGLFRSSDDGRTWKSIHGNLPSIAANPLRVNAVNRQGNVYVWDGTYIARSTDRGDSWVAISDTFRDDAGVRLIASLGNEDYLFSDVTKIRAGQFLEYYQALSRSSDAGETWTEVFPNYDNGKSMTQDSTGVLLYSVYGGILESVDTGKTWTSKGGGRLFGQLITTKQGTVLGVYYGQIFRRAIGDTSWSNSRNGIPVDTAFYMVILLDMTERGRVYVNAGNFGIYFSDDDGRDWGPFPMLGLPKDGITALVTKGNDLFAGTTTQGIFRLKEGVTHVRTDRLARPAAYSLDQNYPNPFNPSTIISYQIPKAGFVSLRIYNVLGQEVATLVNEEKQPGEYTVRWDGTHVPSGIYFYRMQSGSYRETRKLVVVR